MFTGDSWYHGPSNGHGCNTCRLWLFCTILDVHTCLQCICVPYFCTRRFEWLVLSSTELGSMAFLIWKVSRVRPASQERDEALKLQGSACALWSNIHILCTCNSKAHFNLLLFAVKLCQSQKQKAGTKKEEEKPLYFYRNAVQYKCNQEGVNLILLWSTESENKTKTNLWSGTSWAPTQGGLMRTTRLWNYVPSESGK